MKLICFIILQLQVFTGSMNSFIENFQSKSGNEAVNISVSIRNTVNGKEVYQYNSAMNLPPASTLKLLTTATAFKYLGEDFRFETMVYANGRIHGSILKGDLVIEGVGDPSLGSHRFKNNPFQKVLNILKEYNIKSIEGSIKIANNDKIDFPLSWLITDIGNYYGAFPNNLNFLENFYTVYFNGGEKVGDPVQISKIHPYDSSWKIRNEVKTGDAGTGDRVNILNLPFSNDIKMVGTVPLRAKNFAVKGAIPNINNIFTDSLSNYLTQHGIIIGNHIFSEKLTMTEIGSIVSPSIAEIARETNFQSVNFFADGLANYIWQSEAESFSDFVSMFWTEEGVNLSMHSIYDGSGLAPQNSFSSKSMTHFLQKMSTDKAFKASIPTVGRDGTVAYMGKNTNGRISAKSGSISGTRNYSGYFTALNGKQYTFSIFVNGFTRDNSRALTPFFNDFFTKILSLKE